MNELPVVNVGDGDGTVIAGTPNKYLNLHEAPTCPIARAYLVREFNKLSTADQQAWMAEQDTMRLAFVTGMVALDTSTFIGIMAYTQIQADEEPFLAAVYEYVNAQFTIVTDEDHDAFSDKLFNYGVEQGFYAK
jgi:hypothetical protein